MPLIYKITNCVNGKIYIGLTTRTLELRWKEHCRHNNQVIDKAIQKYGKDNFSLEILEECSDELLDEREKYWIKYYDSFKNGYNVTAGGRRDGAVFTQKMDDVLNLWNEGLTLNRIQKITKLNIETVRSYLNKNGITHEEIRKRANYFIGKAKAKPIGQYDHEGKLVKIWESQAEIVRNNNFSKSTLERALKGNKLLNDSYWRRI